MPASLDNLLEILPQQRVAGFGWTEVVNPTTRLVSCRLPDERSLDILDLSPDEYEFLLLAAQGTSHALIAKQLHHRDNDTRLDTFRIQQKLRVASVAEATSFIPIDAGIVSDVKPALKNLTPDEEFYLGRFGQGATVKELAFQNAVGESTVRTHRLNIASKLGIKDRLDPRGIFLRRVLGALYTIKHHEDEIRDSLNLTEQ